MKVLFLPLYNYNWASSRCRVYLYKERLKAYSISVHILPPPNPNIISRGIYLFKILYFFLWADVIYIQKKTFPRLFLSTMKVINSRIIFDLDDAIYARPTSVEAHLFDAKNCERQLINMVKRCRQVVVGNTYLYQYVMKYNSRIAIIPTPVDHKQFSILVPETLNSKSEKRREKVVIGWVGKSENLIYLDLIKDALQQISNLRQNMVNLKIISNKPYFIEGVDIINQSWNIENEVENLRPIDIGLMPLVDDEWSHGKCSFKALQFMCLGIPVVISPVGANKELVIHGKNGYLANTNEEWIKYLLDLIDDEKKRKILGLEGRKSVIAKYTYEVTTPLLMKVLREVFSN